jgi:hypothetical protein
VDATSGRLPSRQSGVLTGEHLQALWAALASVCAHFDAELVEKDDRTTCDGQPPTQLAVARLVNPLKGVYARRLAALPGANPLVVSVVPRRVGQWHPMGDAQDVQPQPRALDLAGANTTP